MTHSTSRSQTHDEDRQISQAVDDYLSRVDRGERPDWAEFLERHSNIAEILKAVIPAIEVADADAVDGSGSQNLGRNSVIGDFRIIRQLGRGGMGVVFEAEQISMSRTVALKVLPFAGLLDTTSIRRFHTEVRAAAMLDHPNIVSAYTVGEERGIHYYAMQLIRGKNLAQVLNSLHEIDVSDRSLDAASIASIASGRRCDERNNDNRQGQLEKTGVSASVGGTDQNGATSQDGEGEIDRSLFGGSRQAYFRTVAALGIRAARALQHAHDLGIIHRDIKPSNILLDRNAQLFITDFGLAHLDSHEALTMSGNLVGTLRYMPPEQADESSNSLDGRADVYALAATLYEMVALRPAFTGSNHAQLMHQISQDDPVPLRRIDKHVPRDLETIIKKSLAKEPGERYRTAGALADDLLRFVEDRSIVARRPTVPQRLAKWARRNTALAWTLIVSLSVICIVLGASIFYAGRSADQLRTSNSVHELVAAFRSWDQDNLTHAQQVLAGLDPRRHGIEFEILGTLVDRSQGRIVAPSGGPWARSPNETKLATVWQDRIIVTRIDDGAELNSISGFDRPYCMAFDPDARRLAIGTKSGLRLVDLTTEKSDLLSTTLPISCRFSPNGKWVAAVGIKDGDEFGIENVTRYEIQVWDAKNLQRQWGEQIYQTPRYDHFRTCAFTKDSERIVTVFKRQNQGFKVWSTDGTPVNVPDVDTYTTDVQHAVWWDSQSVILAFNGATEGVQRLFLDGSKSQNPLLSPELPDYKNAGMIALSANRSRLAVFSRTISVWDLRSGEQIWQRFPVGTVGGFRFVGNNRLLVQGERSVRVFDVGERLYTQLPVDGEICFPCQIQMHQNTLLLPDQYQCPVVWNLADGRNRRYLNPSAATMRTDINGDRLSAIRLAPDGTKIAATIADNGDTVLIWDAKSGDLIQASPLGHKIFDLAFTPDGETLVAAERDSIVAVDVASGHVRWRFNKGGSTWRIAISPDGSTLVAGEWDGRLTTWSLAGTEPTLRSEAKLGGNILALSISHDSRWLVAGDGDGNLRSINLHNPSESVDLQGHASKVNHVSFSPDGKTVLSGGSDGRLAFWRVDSWRATGELVFEEPVHCAGFVNKTNGDRTLAVATREKQRIEVFSLPLQAATDWTWTQTDDNADP